MDTHPTTVSHIEPQPPKTVQTNDPLTMDTHLNKALSLDTKTPGNRKASRTHLHDFGRMHSTSDAKTFVFGDGRISGFIAMSLGSNIA